MWTVNVEELTRSLRRKISDEEVDFFTQLARETTLKIAERLSLLDTDLQQDVIGKKITLEDAELMQRMRGYHKSWAKAVSEGRITAGMARSSHEGAACQVKHAWDLGKIGKRRG